MNPEVLDNLRSIVLAKTADRRSLQTEMDSILEGALADGKRNLNETEETRFAEVRDAIRSLDSELDSLNEKVKTIESEARNRELRDAQAKELGLEVSKRETHIGGIREARTYREGGEHSFFADLYASQTRGDYRAAERLERHMQEARVEREVRDIGTSAVAGMVPPKYLVDKVALLARAGRPFLNALDSMPLPAEGMSFVVPRETTGASADAKSEGSAFDETDIAVTDGTFRAELITAQQDISRALFERGGSVSDQLIFKSMDAAYHTKLDSIAINGSGTSPQHRGVLNVSSIEAVAYTDASPTVAELHPKLADAAQRINANRFAAAEIIIMHPRRWGWITAALDSTGRPLAGFTTQAPQNAIAFGKAAEYGQIVGAWSNLPILTDANIPTNLGAGTNEDIIIVCRASDIYLWEQGDGDPVHFTFEQTQGPEKVRLAVGGFSGFFAGSYPKSIATIGGTGLVTPTF